MSGKSRPRSAAHTQEELEPEIASASQPLPSAMRVAGAPPKPYEHEAEKPEEDETLDDPENKKSEKRLKHATLGMQIAVATGFALEIGISAATGNIGFLGTVNLLAERYFTKPETTIEFIKDIAESPLGQTVGSVLEFLGSPPVKRAIKVAFGVATFAALGAASGGIIPAVGLGLTLGAVALTSIRDYRSSAKMRTNLEMVKKTGELREIHAKSHALTQGVKLDLEAQNALNAFLMPPELLADNPKPKPGIYERIVRTIAPKRAQDFLLSSYMRELKNTVFWNGVECMGAAATGNFFDVASILLVGTISENKHRTEHRELKQQTRNTIAADMKALGLEGRKFKNIKEAEKAIDRQKFFISKIEEMKKDGVIKDGDQESLNAAIKNLTKNIDALYSDHCKKIAKAKEEEEAKKPFIVRSTERLQSVAKEGVMKYIVGYLTTWNPISEHYRPDKFAKRAREDRATMQARIASYKNVRNIVGIEFARTGRTVDVELQTQHVRQELVDMTKSHPTSPSTPKKAQSQSKTNGPAIG